MPRSPRRHANPLLNLLVMFALLPGGTVSASDQSEEAPPADSGQVRCANLIYGQAKSSVCFSDAFLTEIDEQTNIEAYPEFVPVELGSPDLFDHPYAVMTGEGSFELTSEQRGMMRDYLVAGGFIVASAGCSSEDWNRSFAREIEAMFPDRELAPLNADHAIFHTVYDIEYASYRTGPTRLPELHALQIDGRAALIWSPDGLNDTANADPECCCCGGNEIKSARRLNVNILAYALTH